ncbi:OadG family transporter subunit [Blautia sp.]
MKTIKKITSVCMALLVMAALIIGSTSMVFAADEVDDSIKNSLVTATEGWTDQIIGFSDEEMEGYLNSEDGFTKNAAEAWKSAKDELGKKKDNNGETIVTLKDGLYTVTVPVKFEKADANFVYSFDSTMTPSTLSVDVQYSMAQTLQRAGLNTLMGIGTVFVMLVLLSLLISLFRFIPNPEAKKAAEAKAAKAAKEAEAAAVAPAVQTAEENLADDGELVAVIAAAIAAAEGTTTDGFVVRSIRKAKRSRR